MNVGAKGIKRSDCAERSSLRNNKCIIFFYFINIIQ